MNTFREAVRDKVFYNLVLFALLILASSRILGLISSGQDVKIVMDLGMALSVQPTFALVDLRGTLIDTLTLYDDGAHDDGEANDGVYGGLYTPVMPGSFYLQVEGQTPAGEPFRRLDLVPLTFQRMMMYVSGYDTRFVQPGGAELYTFVIHNMSTYFF